MNKEWKMVEADVNSSDKESVFVRVAAANSEAVNHNSAFLSPFNGQIFTS